MRHCTRFVFCYNKANCLLTLHKNNLSKKVQIVDTYKIKSTNVYVPSSTKMRTSLKS